MIKRLLYPTIVLIYLAFLNFVLEPYLFELKLTSVISELQYSLVFWTLNAIITIVLALIIVFMGNRIAGVKQISMMVIANVLLDLYRIYTYPALAFETGIASMFSGIFICAYGLVIIKSAVFKKGAGLPFLLLGPIYILRFPFFVDIMLHFSLSTVNSADRFAFYLHWNIYPNYLVIFLQLIALDSLVRERHTILLVKERLYGTAG